MASVGQCSERRTNQREIGALENPLGTATEEVRQEVFAAVMIARTRQQLLNAMGEFRKDADEFSQTVPNAGYIVLAAWDHALREAVDKHTALLAGKPGYEEAYDLIEEVFNKAREATSNAG